MTNETHERMDEARNLDLLVYTLKERLTQDFRDSIIHPMKPIDLRDYFSGHLVVNFEPYFNAGSRITYDLSQDRPRLHVDEQVNGGKRISIIDAVNPNRMEYKEDRMSARESVKTWSIYEKDFESIKSEYGEVEISLGSGTLTLRNRKFDEKYRVWY